MRICHHCGAQNADGREACQSCGKRFDALPSSNPDATKVCPYCAETIKAAATVCRFCQRDLTTPTAVSPPTVNAAAQPTKPKGMGCGTGLIVLAVIVIGGFLFLSVLGRNPRSGPAAVDRISAFVACKDWVGRSLKAPTQAEWPTANEATITQSNQVWRVVSYVDAPNSFNAKIRNTYDCAVTFSADGKNWTGESLTIGDTVVK